MKKRLLSVALLMGTSFVAQAQVGIGTATPNKSAELSVVASNRGLLIPNVALSDIKDEKTITNGNEESLLVFNTNTTPSKDATLSVTPGYYYWHIDRWHRMTSESDIPQIVVNQFENILNIDGDKVKNIIKGLFSQTLTVLSYDADKNEITYKDEDGVDKIIALNTSDLTYDSKTNTFVFTDANGKENNIALNNTGLSFDSNTGILNYKNSKGEYQTIDLSTVVKEYQNNVKVIAGKNIEVVEDATQKNLVTYTLDVPNATKDTPGVVRPGAGLEVSSDGTLNVDYTDLNSELANGTILSSSINVMMDKGSVHPTFSDVTLEIAPGKQGQVLVTGKDANGNAVTTWEDKATGTTNTLELEADPKADNYNKLTSSVNGVESTIDLNNAVNTDMLQSNSVTADKVDESVAGNGLVKNEITGALDVDYTDLNSELANGTILSSSINVMMDKGSVHPTFSDVTLEIAPGKQGQVLVTGKDANGNAVTTWEDKAGTTNTLELEADPTADNYNKLTSTVNGVESTIDLNNAVNTDMLQSNSVTADKVDESVAGNGLVKNEITGALDVDYTDLNSELANGTILSSSINVMMDKGSVHPTFSDVTLEIAAGEEGQVLTSVENADGSTTTVWKNVPSLNLEGNVILENGKTVVEGIQNVPVSKDKPTTDGQTLVYETDKDGNGQWVPGMPDVNVENILDAKDLTTDGKISIATATPAIDGDTASKKQGAVLVDTHLSIAKGSISTIEIENGTIKPEDIAKGGNDKVLSTDEQGTPQWMDKSDVVKANQNNVEVIPGTNIEVEVEVDATEKNLIKYTLNVPNATKDTPGVVKPGAGLNVEEGGILNVDYPNVKSELAKGVITSNTLTVSKNKGENGDETPIKSTFEDVQLEIKAGTAGQVLTTIPGENEGDLPTVSWEDVKASMPKFFYMPSVMMPTMKEQASSQVTYDEGTAKFVVDLYAIYEEQFGSPKLSYNAGEEKLPVLDKKELAFHITWYDSTVFTNVSFDDNGKLSYTVASDADVTVGSFMNIVFEVK